MPKKAFRYVCPYCDTDYATEEEAEDCLNGHMMSDIYRARKFLCIYCDEVFDVRNYYTCYPDYGVELLGNECCCSAGA